MYIQLCDSAGWAAVSSLGICVSTCQRWPGALQISPCWLRSGRWSDSWANNRKQTLPLSVAPMHPACSSWHDELEQEIRLSVYNHHVTHSTTESALENSLRGSLPQSLYTLRRRPSLAALHCSSKTLCLRLCGSPLVAVYVRQLHYVYSWILFGGGLLKRCMPAMLHPVS